MFRLRAIGFIVTHFLLALAGAMLIPTLVSLLTDSADVPEFLLSALAIAGAAMVMRQATRTADLSIQPRDMFLLTTGAWLLVSAAAAMPFVFISHISYTDAFFETMSGITTTGATVLVGLDRMSPAILIWRSLLQWFGGIGFIVMGVSVLPFLAVGGMRLFHTESSDWSSKTHPRVGNMSQSLLRVYVGLTLLNGLAYWFAGMSPFDAVNHAMTTVSTGGYSTHDASLGYFQQPAIHWVAIFFMLAGSLPFVLYIQLLHGRAAPLWRDQQVRGFLLFLALTVAGLSAWMSSHEVFAGLASLRPAALNVISVVTTTGFVYGDYSAWGELAAVIFFYLMFVGGCSGSTTGSVKFFRYQIAAILLSGQIRRLIHPRLVTRQTYNRQSVDDDVIQSIVAFSFFYALTVAVVAMLLAAEGLDALTSLSAAASAVGNVGPGLGPVVGPSGNYASLPDSAKWILSAGMLMGRLEIITVLVVLSPTFWRQ